MNAQGEERIGVEFDRRSVLHVFPHQVVLSDAKFTTGESIIGDASTYQLRCGIISFESLLGLRFDSEQDEFLVTSSGPVPATPGAILVPWCEAFKLHGDEKKSLLAKNVEQRHSDLKLVCLVNSGPVGLFDFVTSVNVDRILMYHV